MRSLRSEIVGTLKKHALSIFQITNIQVDDFLDPDARAASTQLEVLRKDNNFLYATEDTLPGLSRIEQYYRSECIARVSPFLSLCSQLVITHSKALRLVLLGPRAIDGTNKQRRSQSRAKKFAVTELPMSLLAFVATVVCFFQMIGYPEVLTSRSYTSFLAGHRHHSMRMTINFVTSLTTDITL